MSSRRRYFSRRKSYRTDALVIFIIAIVFSVVAIYHFTTRTYAEKQRRKACLLLEQIYRMERTYHEQYGTYLPIDGGRFGDILQLDEGHRYHYRVEVPDSNSFTARAWADLNGDGRDEVWVVGQANPAPVNVERD